MTFTQVLHTYSGKLFLRRISRLRPVVFSKVLPIIVALLLLPPLLIQCHAGFFEAGFFLAHDEAEHLHVVFSLARGERPYVDYIENHPVLFHFVLLWITKILDLNQVMSVFWLGKAMVFIHFLGCLTLLSLALQHFSSELKIKSNVFALLVISLSISGIWTVDSDGGLAHHSLWELRPDWLCHFYAMSCIYLHFAYHWRLFRGEARLSLWSIAAAAFCGALATAILAKSIYLFLPYAILVLSLCCTEHRAVVSWWKSYCRQVVAANTLFVIVGAASFCALVWVELQASRVSVVEYYNANFVINSSKHVLFYPDDFSSVNVFRSLLGFGIIPSIFLGMWVMHRLAMAQRQGALLEYYIWYFLLLIIAVNLMLPSFTNGLTWTHYFVPSILALSILLALAIDKMFACLGGVVENSPNKGGEKRHFLVLKHIRWALPVLASLVLCATAISKWQGARQSMEDLSYSNQLYGTLVGDSNRDFLPDRFMPNDLTYLIFRPSQKPVKARAWGYFFMLGPDKNFWRHTYELGLAPEPGSYWKRLYSVQPPDVMAFSSKGDFIYWRQLLKKAQQVDINWMWTRILTDYTCIARKSLGIYVRNELLARFQSDGWNICIEKLGDRGDEKGLAE